MADPEIIKSRHSGTVTKDGVTVEVCIYRLTDTNWTLEVVDSAGTFTVWDDEFTSDDEAHAEFMSSIEEGMLEYQQPASKRAN
jgi:RPA family protein